MNQQEWFKLTRLQEEVPGVPEEEAYYIWHQGKAIWHGHSAQAGYDWAEENGIVIEIFERFEP